MAIKGLYPPEIINDLTASNADLAFNGIHVTESGERIWVGRMSNDMITRLTNEIAKDAQSKEDEIAKGWSYLHCVRGEMAYDMIEQEIDMADSGLLFDRIVNSNPMWRHLKREHRIRGMAFVYQRI